MPWCRLSEGAVFTRTEAGFTGAVASGREKGLRLASSWCHYGVMNLVPWIEGRCRDVGPVRP
nr:hypothetical protein KPHV_80100 [Kitasatospora purpeofusca]